MKRLLMTLVNRSIFYLFMGKVYQKLGEIAKKPTLQKSNDHGNSRRKKQFILVSLDMLFRGFFIASSPNP